MNLLKILFTLVSKWSESLSRVIIGCLLSISCNSEDSPKLPNVESAMWGLPLLLGRNPLPLYLRPAAFSAEGGDLGGKHLWRMIIIHFITRERKQSNVKLCNYSIEMVDFGFTCFLKGISVYIWLYMHHLLKFPQLSPSAGRFCHLVLMWSCPMVLWF